MKKFKRHSIILGLSLGVFSFVGKAQVKTLDDYINAAIANSPVLKDYNIQLQQNGIDSIMEGTDYKPQVGARGVAMYAPAYGQFGYDQAVTNGGEYDAVISVTQQIAPRKQLVLKRMLSASERNAINNEEKIEENDIRKEVTDKYLAVCLLQQKTAFYVQSDSFLVKEASVVKQLAEKGSYKISDYYALLVEEQSEQTQIKQLNIDLTESFDALNVLCGVIDTTAYKLTVPQIAPYQQNDSKMLLVYQKFQVDSTKLAQQNMLIDASYKPNLSWYADAGLEASQPNLIYKSFGNSLGLNLAIPIYDGHKRSLKHQYLQLSEDSRANYEHFFLMNYNARINSLAKQIADGNKLVMQLHEEDGQVQKWIKINEAEMAVGNVSVTDFLLSLKKNLEVKSELNEAQINQQLLQNEFNYWNH